MAGGLRVCASFWREMGASRFVMRVIEEGYLLPFVQLPVPKMIKNHASAHEHAEFVSTSVEDLVRRRCVLPVNEADVVVCSPLGVVDNGKKLRLILDLRYVNEHLAKFKFKLEDIKMLAEVYSKGDYLVCFDLKSGYHHIAIAEEHQKYLAFAWEVNSVKKYFMFAVLPFGLSTAPYIFTKVTRVLLRRWRGRGIRCTLYMDDGTGGAESFEKAVQVAKIMQSDLQNAGFVVNKDKSQWIPSQSVSVLGYDLNLKAGRVSVGNKRVQSVKALVFDILKQHRPGVRDVAKFTGLIMSMSFVLGNISRLRTRCLYSMVNSRRSWFSRVSWCPGAREEVSFWGFLVGELNTKTLWPKSTAVSFVIWSDASDSGWGGHTTLPSGKVLTARGDWPEEIKICKMSSTWRELRAILLVLQSFQEHLKSHACTVRSDNAAAVQIIACGSRKNHLQVEALNIFRFCLEFEIQLHAEWIPREENELADFYSKLQDCDDWQVDPHVFAWLDGLWGPHTLDCFASAKTKQLTRYCSRWWNPGCLAVDAFTVSWENEKVWLTPPICLIFRVLRMLAHCKGHGTLIVPEWKSAPWWPLVHSEYDWHSFVKDAVLLPDISGTFVHGTCAWNAFNGEKAKWPVWALKLCWRTGCCES